MNLRFNSLLSLSLIACLISILLLQWKGEVYFGKDVVKNTGLLFSLLPFLPLIFSRFLLRHRPISILETLYVPVAYVALFIFIDVYAKYPISQVIPDTIANGSGFDASMIFTYISFLSCFILAYFTLISFRLIGALEKILN